MTLTQILTALYARMREASSPPTAVTTRFTQFVNEGYHRILAEPGLELLRFGQLQFASVASQAQYGLQVGIARVRSMRETTNDQHLLPMALDAYRQIEPDPASNTGTPEYFVPLGYAPVATMPASTGLWVASSSASDTTQTARVIAIRADGTQDSLSVTLTGTTRAQLGTNTTYRDVLEVKLSAAAVGAVSLFDASSSGNTLGTIPIGRTFSRYWRFALWPTPSAAITYDLDFEHQVVELTAANTTDEPILPIDFHDLLILFARREEYEFRDDARYTVAAQDYDKRLRQLKAWLHQHPLIPVRDRRPRSQLGPYFEAGT